MYKLTNCLLIVQLLHLANAGVLIWGSESLQLPSLKQFNNEDFDLLKSYMRRPKVLVFKGDPMEISSELQNLLRNKYTAYVPNSNLNIDNVIELNGDANSNFKLIEDTINRSSQENDNILALILTNHEAARVKREVDEEATTDVPDSTTTTTTTTEMNEPTNDQYEPINGPVMYQASTLTEEVVMIYSSQTPVLNINATSYSLGKATMVTVDDRPDKYRQLSVSIPIESNRKLQLRFRYTWSRGYWYLNTISLLGVSNKPISLNATREDEISAAKRFSYHCSATTAFRDEENGVELLLFDLQTQPDADAVRFADAYDCIYFITVPIWSGLYIVAILLAGLAIGVGALNSIKTMDKFDNNKTKQLTITGE